MYSILLDTVLKSNKNILYTIFITRLKNILKELDRKYLNGSTGQKGYIPAESIKNILNKNIILDKEIIFNNLEINDFDDDNKFTLYIKSNISEKLIDKNLLEILKSYFENNLNNKDEEDKINIEISNKRVLFKKINFNETRDYYNIFDKLHFITFDYCEFNIPPIFIFNDNKTLKLKFNNCKFFDHWKYIESDNTIYSKCEIDYYEHVNISENREDIKPLLFYDCNIKNINFEGVSFTSRLFKFSNLMTYEDIDSIRLFNCKVTKDFVLNNSNSERNGLLKIKNIDLTNSVFTKGTKVKIQFFDIDNATFYNTKFEDLADFYQTKFKKVNFKRADFLSISVFSESIFNCNVDFSYVKFFGKAIFRDTVINGRLNLRDTIFDDEANFLDIKRINNTSTENSTNIYIEIEVENRETARVIKNFYDNSNNIIEANKFYALEMKEREKELEEDKNKGKNLLEYLVFKVHGLASNHSQNWIQSLFWILSFSFIYAFINCINNHLDTKLEFIIIDIFIYLIGIFISVLVINNKKINNYLLIIVFYIIYGFISNDFTLYTISNNINPFSIMTGLEELSFLTLSYKIVIAYLLYQLIISIRQNTRRK